MFEAYVNHRTELIFLDVPEGRPHSEVNSERTWAQINEQAGRLRG